MNKKIFINGSSSKIGGSRQILNSLIEKISEYGNEEDYNYIILVPNITEFKHINKKHIFFKQIPKTLNKTFLVPINSLFLIPSMIKKSNIDIVFNLGDIPLKTSIKQIMLFDWPYAIYDDPIVWKLMSKKEFISRKIKLIIFKYNLSLAANRKAQRTNPDHRIEHSRTRAFIDRIRQFSSIFEADRKIASHKEAKNRDQNIISRDAGNIDHSCKSREGRQNTDRGDHRDEFKASGFIERNSADNRADQSGND